MNRDEKAAVIDEVAERIQGSQAIFAVDYRGLSVKQAVELRQQLTDAGTHFQVVKNRLTIRAADKAGAEDLKAFLEGPTALAFVEGDAAVAAKAIATFRRANNLLEWKGGTLDGDVLSVDQLESIAKLPAREVLHGQFVGVLASPVTGLVRGLASMISGLASQLQQIADQGLVSGEAPADDAAPAEASAEGEADSGEASGDSGEASDDSGEASGDSGEASDDSGEASDESATDTEAAPDEKEPAAAAEAAAAVKDEEESAAAEEAAAEEPTPAEEAPGSPTAEGETAEQEEASGDAPDETSETSEEPSEAENQEEEG